MLKGSPNNADSKVDFPDPTGPTMATSSPRLIRRSGILKAPLAVDNDTGTGGGGDGGDGCSDSCDVEVEGEEVEEEVALACSVDESVDEAVVSCPSASPCPGACIATGGAVHEKVPPSIVIA